MTEQNRLTVGIADIKVSVSPDILTTTLGSCVAVCLYDKVNKIGGMVHVMMPSSVSVTRGTEFKKAKYADTGIHELLSMLERKGFDKKKAEAKIFGGGKVLKQVSKNIGEENVSAVKGILKENGLSIKSSKTGGEKGYRVVMELETGKVVCQIFGEDAKEY